MSSFRQLPAWAAILCLGVSFGWTQEPEKPAEAEPPAAPASEKPVVVPEGTHLALVLLNTINTKSARAGDYVYFETTFPVVVENRILIPAGSYVRGTVTQAKRPGRVKGRGELHVRFDELTLPNGYVAKLTASLANAGAGQGEEVDRSEGGIKGDTAKGADVGTVIVGTGAGAGIGSAIGAAAGNAGAGAGIGAGAGLAAGLATILLTRGPELELPRGSTFDVVFNRALELDPALARFEWAGSSTSLPGPALRQQQRPLSTRIP
jgi:type IV secretion system protein VirB10